ncbi:MAG TPA: hypothetical protein VK915_01275 [Gaiellaceae bacterium]|nr:hypothetical protein [Gaiellaceae bacterium]
MSPASWLVELERSLAETDEGTEALATGLVVLATVCGREVHVDEDEAHGAARRALLLLGAGGDPSRGLDLHGRAVGSIADDLRTVDRQLALEDGISRLRLEAQGLPHVSEALRALADAPDVAWRAFAAGILVEELGGADEEEA